MKNLTRALMLFSLLVAAPALAIDKTPAKAVDREAGEALADGDFNSAARIYLHEGQASGDPKYIKLAAENYSKGGSHAKAARTYAIYLEKVPNAPANIREAMETEKKTPDAQPVAQQAQPAARPTSKMRRPIHMTTSSSH